MDTQRWERIGDVFEQLLGVPQIQRPHLLDTLCGDDAEMRKIVASMLQSEDSAQDDEKSHLATPVPLDANRQALDQIDAALAGTRIGPWRLERKVGTGGMGVVWLAARADGQFEQRVALKLIKRGMDSDAVLARFLRERQILARLEHPHIAHLIDGGVATDGRPYFAMEYVDGVPLMRYCHDHGAKLEERIALFLDVCDALQFAHEHHVVHRDLKPSNVLVTANGSVKLLDFGIAKLIEGDGGTAATLTDMQRERPMTPAYAAPEQIAGGKISEKTDVYSLGCVLYELLTGQHAHDFSAAAGARDVLRIVQSTDPVAPSRLKLTHAPVSLRRLRGDLDTIVLTALKRAPERRYASVAAFAADLKNYLAGKPISARRDNAVYRSYKFYKRHRAVVGAATAVFLALACAAVIVRYERQQNAAIPAGSAIAIVGFANLDQNEKDGWISTALQEELATELAIGGTLHTLPGELVRPARADLPEPTTGGYAQVSLQTLRKRLGADYVLSGSYLVSGAADDAKLRLDIAFQDARNGAAIAKFGQSENLANLPVLVKNVGAALRETLEGAVASPAELLQVSKAQPSTLELGRHMGLAMEALNKSDPALASSELQQAVALSPGYAPAYFHLSQAWSLLGFDARALAAAQQAAAFSDNLPPLQRLQIARQVAVQKSEWPKALELDKQLLALSPTDPEVRLNMIDDLLHAGQPTIADTRLKELGNLPGTDQDPRIEIQASKVAAALGDSAAQASHADRALQQALARGEMGLVANARMQLGQARSAQDRRDEAEVLLRQATKDYQNVGNPQGEADARKELANLLVDQDRPQEARDEYQRALAIYERTGDQRGLAVIYSDLGRMLWEQGDREAALTDVQRSLQIERARENLAGQAWNLTALAIMQADESATDDTMETFRQAIALDDRAGARIHHVYALNEYMEVLRVRGELELAQQVCAEAQAEATQLSDPSSAVNTSYQCALVAFDRGEIETAVSGLEQVQDAATKLDDSTTLGNTYLNLALIDIAKARWTRARDRLDLAMKDYLAGEVVAGQAAAQSLIALCFSALNQPAERDHAAEFARDLRSRITAHREVFAVDVALAQLRGMSGESERASADLQVLAADATERHWVSQALEARLAALQLMEAAHSPKSDALRTQIESDARAHGFGWVLARLPANN